jgi:hypothetical protein
MAALKSGIATRSMLLCFVETFSVMQPPQALGRASPPCTERNSRVLLQEADISKDDGGEMNTDICYLCSPPSVHS